MRVRPTRPYGPGLAGLLALWLVAAPIEAWADEPPDPFFSMDASYVSAGQSFDVPIYFGTNVPVRSVVFDLTYDPAVVQVDAISEGGFFRDFAQMHGGGTTFSPGSVDSLAGEVSGVAVGLSGTPAEGPVKSGELLVIHFAALNVHAKSVTRLVNYHILDLASVDLAPYTYVTGGLVQVGTGPQLSITSLTTQVVGVGEDYGKQFWVSFALFNLNGITSDPGTAVLSVLGATPGLTQLVIPPIDPDESLTIEIPEVFTLAGNVEVGDTAEVNLSVLGDGHRAVTYTYQPVIDIKLTDIDATVLPFISIAAPALIAWPDLQLGLNQASANLTVHCNASYQVDVSDQGPTHWRLTEWDGTRFMSRRLHDPLHMLCPALGTDVSRGTPTTLIHGGLSGQSLDDGQDFAVLLQQTRHAGDAALAGERSYHMALTQTGYIFYRPNNPIERPNTPIPPDAGMSVLTRNDGLPPKPHIP